LIAEPGADETNQNQEAYMISFQPMMSSKDNEEEV